MIQASRLLLLPIISAAAALFNRLEQAVIDRLNKIPAHRSKQTQQNIPIKN